MNEWVCVLVPSTIYLLELTTSHSYIGNPSSSSELEPDV